LTVNYHFLNRYYKFIENSKTENVKCGEIHHILPRCMGGTNSPTNLILLSYRRHFIAHWLLYLAYPNNYKLTYAFYAMCNKNSKRAERQAAYKKFKSSRTYEKLKIQAIQQSRKYRKDKVYAKDEYGNQVVLTKEEYQQNKNKYTFHTSGMIWCKDIKFNTMVYIPTELYHASKQFLKYVAPWTESNPTVTVICNGIEQPMPYCTFKKIKNNTNEDIKQKFYGNLEKIKEKMVVFSITENKYVRVSIDEYYKNPNLYITPTKEKVLAKSKSTGELMLISKNEFASSGNFVGQTKGLCTVKCKTTGKFIQISQSDFNKLKYEGPNKGKVNVINTKTGVRMQIEKSDFDPSKFINLGNTRLYVKCRNRLTNKIKNITIIELIVTPNLVKEWEILDHNQYDRAKLFLDDFHKTNYK